jgi:hypothetical protein
MNKIACARAALAATGNLFQIEDEPEVSTRNAPAPDVWIGHNKSIWADTRRANVPEFGQAFYPQCDQPLFLQQRADVGFRIRMGTQWFDVEDIPFVTVRIPYARSPGLDEEYPHYDAGAVVEFFKEANSEDFGSFCRLLEAEPLQGNILVRVEKIAALTNRPSGLASWLKKLLPAVTGPAAQRAQPPASTSNVRNQLDSISELIAEGHLDKALDNLYPWIDGLLRQEKFSVVDPLFREVDVNTAPRDLILGLLIGTLPVRRRMKSRPSFISGAKTALTERGEMEEGLFDGLE